MIHLVNRQIDYPKGKARALCGSLIVESRKITYIDNEIHCLECLSKELELKTKGKYFIEVVFSKEDYSESYYEKELLRETLI